MNIINGVCPNCEENELILTSGSLQYVNEYYPYNLEHLKCTVCDSTFNIGYNQMHSRGTNNLTSKIMDIVLEEFKQRGMEISVQRENSLFDKFHKSLEEFSSCEY